MSTIKSSDEHLTLNADGNSKDIKLQSNGSEKVIIKSDGKVGISTSAPSTNLEVEADDNSTTTFPVKVINSAGTGSTQIGAYAIDTTSVDLTLKAGGNTALTVDKDNGKIGINTTSPSFPLHVNGTIKSVGTNNLPALIVDANSTNEGDIVCLDGQALTFGHHTLDGNTGGFTMAMKIHSNGAVVKPLQPAFSVIKNSDESLAPGGDRTMTWQTEEFDVGSNFASNIFTAPVSGTYFLHAMVRIDNVDTAATYYRTAINTSNKSKYEIIKPLFTSDSSYMSMSVASIFDMDAGDTAKVTVRQQAGSTQAHIDDTGHYTNFCGYLLG